MRKNRVRPTSPAWRWSHFVKERLEVALVDGEEERERHATGIAIGVQLLWRDGQSAKLMFAREGEVVGAEGSSLSYVDGLAILVLCASRLRLAAGPLQRVPRGKERGGAFS